MKVGLRAMYLVASSSLCCETKDGAKQVHVFVHMHLELQR